MSTASGKNWSKLTIAELKAELTKRSLSTTGNKIQLINKLKADDEIKLKSKKEITENIETGNIQNGEEKGSVAVEKVDVPEDVKMETNNVKEEPEVMISKQSQDVEDDKISFITKGRFMSLYCATVALKTVIIKPFNVEFFSSLCKWIPKCDEFNIKMDRDGTSAAMLVLNSVNEGDAAFLELKETFSGVEGSVFHLSFNHKSIFSDETDFDSYFTFKTDGTAVQRQVILENLPETVTEQTIRELFPEGFNIIHCGNDIPSKGIALMELRSVAAVEEFVKKHSDLMIENCKIPVAKYTSRLNKWGKKSKAKKKTTKSPNEESSDVTENLKSLTNEERMHMYEQLHSVTSQRESIQDREDLFGLEKLEESLKLHDDWKRITAILIHDTNRRIKEKQLPLPEPEEYITGRVKELLDGKTNEDNKDKKAQSKVKEVWKSKSEVKPTETKKRPSTTPMNKSFPPNKKQTFISGTTKKGQYFTNQNRFQDASHSAGREYDYRNNSRGGMERGWMGRGRGRGAWSDSRLDFPAERSVPLIGPYPGGNARHSMVDDVHINMRSNTGSSFEDRATLFRKADDFDRFPPRNFSEAEGNRNMEHMIMNLSEKLSRLERSQLGNEDNPDTFQSAQRYHDSYSFARGDHGNRNFPTGRGFNQDSRGYGTHTGFSSFSGKRF